LPGFPRVHQRNRFLEEERTRRNVAPSLTWTLAAPFYHLEKYIYRNFFRRKPRQTPPRLSSGPGEGMVCWVRGGLGDHLVAAAFLDKIEALDPRHVWIISEMEEVAEWIFWNKRRYTVVGNYLHLPRLEHLGTGFKLAVLPRPLEGFASPAFVRQPGSDAVADLFHLHDPWLDSLAARRGMFLGLNRYSLMGKDLGISFDQDCRCPLRPRNGAQRVLAEHGLKSRGYITFGGGVDDTFYQKRKMPAGLMTTKQLPTPAWESITGWIRTVLPDVPLVRIGKRPVDPSLPCDLDLTGRTDLDEAAWLLKEALFHVDIEGGLVHLAHHLETPSLVFFGPTPAGFFGYRENVNLSNGQCSDCYLLSENWMLSCIRGLDAPICTTGYDEEAVKAGVRLLAERRKQS
jgi:hypothetical protein